MAGKSHVLHSIHHFITGAVLTIKGLDKVSHHPVIGATILLFGLMILGFFFYSIKQKKHGQNLELTVLCFEALVSLFMAYLYFTEGKTFLPYVFLLASAGFMVSTFLRFRKRHAVH